MTIKKYLKNQKNEKITNLQKECIEIALYETEGYTNDETITYFNDILNHGCISGCVGSLIYYHDTVKFYEENKNDINNLLYETFEITGFNNPIELFGSKWNESDPLCIEDENKNLLSWFSFETFISDLMNYNDF